MGSDSTAEKGNRPMTRLTTTEIAALDPYRFMAVIGKRVIHPCGRAEPTHRAVGPAR